MNNKAKRRLVVVGGIVAVAMLVIVAIAGAGGAVSSLTVGDVLAGGYEGKKVQVTGSVVEDSISSSGTTVSFSITPEDGSGEELRVSYEGALPATFGAGVVAICTGTVEEPVALTCTELVTKCPSKYESAEGSLTVKSLVEQGDSMAGVDAKVCGYVRGAINDVDAEYRFLIESQGETLAVVYDGGLSDEIVDGAAVVISGQLAEDGTFTATDQPAIDTSISE